MVWFLFREKSNLEIIKSDIRNVESINLKNRFNNTSANVANDPAVDLNPTMSWEVNVLAGQQLIDKAVRENVKHFILLVLEVFTA